MIHTAEELDAAFAAMESSRVDAGIVQPSLPTKRIAELALKYQCRASARFVTSPMTGV